ncbi:MAG TPA: zf-HC2 domain-containing protein, partial [Candidatus Dormibacteraeota bacterium]|nr:zf-HC2 domain-containing protein [Candidatus Dormibacteraeota bacterium]
MKCSLLTLSCALDGELPTPRQAELEAHLVSCDRCRTGMQYLREETERITSLPRLSLPELTIEALLARTKVADAPTTGDDALLLPLMGAGTPPAAEVATDTAGALAHPEAESLQEIEVSGIATPGALPATGEAAAGADLAELLTGGPPALVPEADVTRQTDVWTPAALTDAAGDLGPSEPEPRDASGAEAPTEPDTLAVSASPTGAVADDTGGSAVTPLAAESPSADGSAAAQPEAGWVDASPPPDGEGPAAVASEAATS